MLVDKSDAVRIVESIDALTKSVQELTQILAGNKYPRYGNNYPPVWAVAEPVKHPEWNFPSTTGPNSSWPPPKYDTKG